MRRRHAYRSGVRSDARADDVTLSTKGMKPTVQMIRFELGADTTIADFFTVDRTSLGSKSVCWALPNRVQTYYNGAKTGAFSKVYGFNPYSFGIPTTVSNPDECGDRMEAASMNSLGRLVQRADNGDGRNTLRHLLGYNDERSGSDAVRCSTCCWPNSLCAGIYETVHWLVQPADP